MRSAVIVAATAIVLALAFATLQAGLPAEAATLKPTPGAAAVWTGIGPYGGRICGLVRCEAFPKVMYAATQSDRSQVFRSDDSGVTWERTAALDDWIYDLAVHPSNPAVVFGLGIETFFRSTDRGTTFKAYRYPNGITGATGKLAVHPANPDILYATGGANLKPNGARLAVLKSTNGGKTWMVTKLDAAADWVMHPGLALCAAAPDTIYASGYIHMDGDYHGRLYKSTNGGTTWTRVTSALLDDEYHLHSLAVDSRDPNRVYVTNNEGIVRSADGGATWAQQTAPARFYPTAVALDPANPKVLYAQTVPWGENPGFYKSQDGGVTWMRHTTGVYGSGVRIFAAGKKVWLGTSAGLFRSDNGGVSFAPSQTGIAAAWVDAFAIAPSSPSTLFAYVSQYGALRTKTRGASWAKGPTFKDIDGVAAVLAHPSNPATVYILTWHYGEDDLFKSTDGGKTFKSVFRKDVNALAGDPGDGNRLALAGRIYNTDWRSGPSYFGIYLSEDGGANGQSIKIRTDDGSEAQAVAFAPSDPKTIYVAGMTAARQAVVYRTADGGATWRLLPGPFESGFYTIAVDPTSANTVYVGAYNGIYRSLNGGSAWTEIHGYWGGQSIAVNPLKPAEIFVGGSNGLLFSRDRGSHWTEYNDDLPIHDVNVIALDPAARIVYAATDGGGIWRRKF